jgi:hypothetical protein
MSHPAIHLSRLKEQASAMHDTGYFIKSLASFISEVGEENPDLCEKALNGYVVGGLMAGLKLIGSDLIAQADEFNGLIEQAEQPVTKRG